MYAVLKIKLNLLKVEDGQGEEATDLYVGCSVYYQGTDVVVETLTEQTETLINDIVGAKAQIQDLSEWLDDIGLGKETISFES